MSRSDEAAVSLAGPTTPSPRGRRRRLVRKAIFGDWHPFLRDPLDLLRLSFAAAAVVFFLAGAAHGFLFQHHAEFAADVDAFLASA